MSMQRRGRVMTVALPPSGKRGPSPATSGTCFAGPMRVDARRLRPLGNGSRHRGPARAVPKYYFEDFSLRWTAEYGPRRVPGEEIIGCAAQSDPQPMHLDEEAARHTMLGGLAASGWHTCAIMMKMIADNLLLDTASKGAPGAA